MKKQISMLLATACAASLLAACGGSGSTAASASAARFHRCIVRGDGCRRPLPSTRTRRSPTSSSGGSMTVCTRRTAPSPVDRRLRR